RQRLPRNVGAADRTELAFAVVDDRQTGDGQEVEVQDARAGEVERQVRILCAEERTERHAVTCRDVDAFGLHATGVEVEVIDPLDLTGAIAADKTAIVVQEQFEARRADVLGSDRRDVVVDLDIVVVDGDREAGSEARLEHGTHGPRGCLLFGKIRVASKERRRVARVGVAQSGVADTCRWNTLSKTNFAELARGCRSRSANVDVAFEAHGVAEEQFADARATDGFLVLPAER